MAQHTDIQWADSTLNLQMGCAGCELWQPTRGIKSCYAGVMTQRYGGRNKGFPLQFERPQLFLERLDKALAWKDLTGIARPEKPWLNGLPRLIFLNDMGDTFTEGLPIDWLAPLLPRMAESRHQFLVLTKRGRRMREFSEQHPFPNNFWPGVSITTNKSLPRAVELLKVRGGRLRWLSIEPMWGPVAIEGLMDALQWLVIGGMSGDQADEHPLDLFCVLDLMSHARAFDTALFIKQLGPCPFFDRSPEPAGSIARKHGVGPLVAEVLKMQDSHGGDWDEWPDEFRVREMPIAQASPVA